MADIPDPSIERPDFEEPWQGEAFALVVSLNRAGHFEWREWVDTLSGEIAADAALDLPRTYYQQWLAALERLLTAKELIDEAERSARKEAWRTAYLATPHGEAVHLGPVASINRTKSSARRAE